MTAAGETSEPVPAVVGTATSRRACSTCGYEATRLRASRNGSVSSRSVELRALVEQPHGLGGVDDRATADGDDRVGPTRSSTSTPARICASVGSGSIAENTCTESALRCRAISSGTPRASLGPSVTITGRRGVHLPQVLERAGVEVRVRRNAEPLRRRLAARDRLDVEQVAVVDVVGGSRAAPGAAAEREGRRHRVVDAAERADGGRRVDEDAPGADRVGEAL